MIRGFCNSKISVIFSDELISLTHLTTQVFGFGHGTQLHPSTRYPDGGGECVSQSGRLLAGLASTADSLECNRIDFWPRNFHHGSSDRGGCFAFQQRLGLEECADVL